jgi:hypothetical protein
VALFWMSNDTSNELLENGVSASRLAAGNAGSVALSDEGTFEAAASFVGLSEAVLIGRILYRLILLAAASLFLFERIVSGCRVAYF